MTNTREYPDREMGEADGRLDPVWFAKHNNISDMDEMPHGIVDTCIRIAGNGRPHTGTATDEVRIGAHAYMDMYRAELSSWEYFQYTHLSNKLEMMTVWNATRGTSSSPGGKTGY